MWAIKIPFSIFFFKFVKAFQELVNGLMAGNAQLILVMFDQINPCIGLLALT
jgi:hypothetical protein